MERQERFFDKGLDRTRGLSQKRITDLTKRDMVALYLASKLNSSRLECELSQLNRDAVFAEAQSTVDIADLKSYIGYQQAIIDEQDALIIDQRAIMVEQDVALDDRARTITGQDLRIIQLEKQADSLRATVGGFRQLADRRRIRKAKTMEESFPYRFGMGVERFFSRLGLVAVRAMEIMAETPQIDPASAVYLTQIPRNTKS